MIAALLVCLFGLFLFAAGLGLRLAILLFTSAFLIHSMRVIIFILLNIFFKN